MEIIGGGGGVVVVVVVALGEKPSVHGSGAD